MCVVCLYVRALSIPKVTALLCAAFTAASNCDNCSFRHMHTCIRSSLLIRLQFLISIATSWLLFSCFPLNCLDSVLFYNETLLILSICLCKQCFAGRIKIT